MSVDIEQIKQKHKEFLSDLLNFKSQKPHEEVLDDHSCSMGTWIAFMSSRDSSVEMSKIRVEHQRFHYLASVIRLHQELYTQTSFEIVDMLTGCSRRLLGYVDDWQALNDK